MRTVSEKYSRLTFILSVIGFIGSLGFYFGVLREVYSDQNTQEVIENLETENSKLKSQVEILIKQVDDCNDHE
ncbi:MAG: hypothetical protein R2780_15765 [Crocinitomicaceae bacterium]